MQANRLVFGLGGAPDGSGGWGGCSGSWRVSVWPQTAASKNSSHSPQTARRERAHDASGLRAAGLFQPCDPGWEFRQEKRRFWRTSGCLSQRLKPNLSFLQPGSCPKQPRRPNKDFGLFPPVFCRREGVQRCFLQTASCCPGGVVPACGCAPMQKDSPPESSSFPHAEAEIPPTIPTAFEVTLVV